MENKEINNAISELIESDGAVNLPGLTAENLVPAFVDKKHARELESISNSQDRAVKRDELISYYLNGTGREAIDEEINNIKINFSSVRSQLSLINKSIESTVQQAAVPAVLTVGAATSSPNPAYTVLDAKGKRDNLAAMLKTVSMSLAKLLMSAAKINFPIPSEISSMMELVKKTQGALNKLSF